MTQARPGRLNFRVWLEYLEREAACPLWLRYLRLEAWPNYLGRVCLITGGLTVWPEFLLQPCLPPGIGPKMASLFVYGYAGRLWSFSNYRALEEWLHPVLCLQGCWLFTEASGQGTGHSDCASWGWLVGYLWPEGFPVTCQRGPAHRSLCKPEPMTCTRQSPASRPPPTFCSICSQSATTQVLYTWDFLKGSILHVPITRTHTHRTC